MFFSKYDSGVLPSHYSLSTRKKVIGEFEDERLMVVLIQLRRSDPDGPDQLHIYNNIQMNQSHGIAASLRGK